MEINETFKVDVSMEINETIAVKAAGIDVVFKEIMLKFYEKEFSNCGSI